MVKKKRSKKAIKKKAHRLKAKEEKRLDRLGIKIDRLISEKSRFNDKDKEFLYRAKTSIENKKAKGFKTKEI